MKNTSKVNLVTKAEFMLANGVCIVWTKEKKGWSVSRYEHGEHSEHITSVGRLPSVENANYFGKLKTLAGA